MATKQKTKPRSGSRTKPELVHEEGFYWIVSGTKRLNVGRNKRVAENMFAEQTEK